MKRALSILITDDDFEISSSRGLSVENNYISIEISHVDLVITNIAAKYVSKSTIAFSVENIDIKDSLKYEAPELYTDTMKRFPGLKQDLDGFPGIDDQQKFNNYLISGIACILSLFGLLQNDTTSSNIMYPLTIAFPDTNIDVNLLNKKFYRFLNYYIQSLENMYHEEVIHSTILKKLLEFISDFWKIFGDAFVDLLDDEQKYQDILCSHAASLGYGKFLENRISNLQIWLDKERESLRTVLRSQEIDGMKYRDEEILKLAEKMAGIKNIHDDLIKDTKNIIKGSKDDLELHTEKLKKEISHGTRKQIEEFVIEKRKEIDISFGLEVKKKIASLEESIVKLENKQANKIKASLNEIVDKKAGFLKELEKNRGELLNSLDTYKTEAKEELSRTRAGTLEEIELLRKSLESTSKVTLDRITTFEELFENCNERLLEFTEIKKEKINEFTKEFWGTLEGELKKQARSIIQSIFDEVIENLGEAIDAQINKKIKDRLGDREGRESRVEKIDSKVKHNKIPLPKK